MDEALKSLSSDSRLAAAMGALLADPFPLQAIFANGVPPEAIDPLFDDGLWEETEPGLARFKSDTTCEAALNSQSWSQRRRLCSNLAETYAKLAREAKKIAYLYLEAHQYAEARDHFVRGADQACREHRYREALDLMRAAFEIWPLDEEPEKRQRLLREMARCAGSLADHGTARLAWSELLEMTDGDIAPKPHRVLSPARASGRSRWRST